MQGVFRNRTSATLPCQDRIGTGPPRARTEVIYEDLQMLRCRANSVVCGVPVHGYLAHKKPSPHGTLPYTYVYGPMVVLGRRALSYERGTPVPHGGAFNPESPRPVRLGFHPDEYL